MKFIRSGQHFIEKNGEGVLAFITEDNTSVLSNAAEESTYGKTGRVSINETQYFNGVLEIAWNFYIGGYQPAQKWLKDRKGRTLTFEDICHYQKIIVSLAETARIMKEIDIALCQDFLRGM